LAVVSGKQGNLSTGFIETRCTGNTSLCDGRDLRPVRFSVEQPRLFCAGCRSASLGREAVDINDFVIERRAAVRPERAERAA
jgi:hypothetical protein